MNHNSLHDPQGGNYGSYTPSASMGFRYNWDIYLDIPYRALLLKTAMY